MQMIETPLNGTLMRNSSRDALFRDFYTTGRACVC